MATTTPYSTAVPLMQNKPTWLNDYDAQRLGSYFLYEDLYRNSPDTNTALLRGADDRPILVPTAKAIVKTLSRYVARGWSMDFVPADPAAGEVDDATYTTAVTAFGTLFKRERWLSLMASGKRTGLKKGDWVFMLLADPAKPEGTRISIKSVDPATYFPITDPGDPDKIVGGELIEQIIVGSDTVLRRQTWRKNTDPAHSAFGNYEAPIEYSQQYLEVAEWEEKPKPYTAPGLVSVPPTALAGINTLPLYHVKFMAEDGDPFGTSSLAGLERIISGINQAVTDEDMALAMAGLGMYATDGGAPIDENGNDVDWLLGPGRVVEVAEGKSFKRVTGVASVEPSQTHISYLKRSAHEVLGINDVALGNVDVSVAESGIALRLRMGPLLDEAEGIDIEIVDVLDQFLHDLKTWFLVYENINLEQVQPVSILPDKIPEDKTAKADFYHKLYLDQAITLESFHDRLRELGFDIPAGEHTMLEDPAGRYEEEAGAADGEAFVEDESAV